MEKDLWPGCGARLGENHRSSGCGRGCGLPRARTTRCSTGRADEHREPGKADLFISIHANSSRDHAARGIETYYLNPEGLGEAMEVAARENATAQEACTSCRDLVMKIARTEKIDESKDLPRTSRIRSPSGFKEQQAVKNAASEGSLGVLIGADMPSS